jgi:hypothetical protein
LATARDIAKSWFEASDRQIADAIEQGVIQELHNGGRDEEET